MLGGVSGPKVGVGKGVLVAITEIVGIVVVCVAMIEGVIIVEGMMLFAALMPRKVFE